MLRIITVAAAAAATPEAAFERYRTGINGHDFERLAAMVRAADVAFVFTDRMHRGAAQA